MDAKRLKIKMVESGLTTSRTAELIGIHKSSLYRKIHGFEKLTVSEEDRKKDALYHARQLMEFLEAVERVDDIDCEEISENDLKDDF